MKMTRALYLYGAVAFTITVIDRGALGAVWTNSTAPWLFVLRLNRTALFRDIYMKKNEPRFGSYSVGALEMTSQLPPNSPRSCGCMQRKNRRVSNCWQFMRVSFFTWEPSIDRTSSVSAADPTSMCAPLSSGFRFVRRAWPLYQYTTFQPRRIHQSKRGGGIPPRRCSTLDFDGRSTLSFPAAGKKLSLLGFVTSLTEVRAGLCQEIDEERAACCSLLDKEHGSAAAARDSCVPQGAWRCGACRRTPPGRGGLRLRLVLGRPLLARVHRPWRYHSRVRVGWARGGVMSALLE